MSVSCEHREVIVDYRHPHGEIPDVPVSELQASDPATTRPIMTVANPRCTACGVGLGAAELERRIDPGGDLFDSRFYWSMGKR